MPNKRPKAKRPPSPADEKTLDVPTAGKRYFGLGRNASYQAVARGEMPVVRIGKMLRVPVIALERMLSEARPKMEAAQ
jgi:hypothetical protein